MNESIKNKKLRISEIISTLKIEYPDSKCSLLYNNPYQLLVATILSAQCTDERVNKVTKKLFRKFPNAQSISKLSDDEIGRHIYSTGFYNNKAKNIKKMSTVINDKYKGKIPSDISLLTQLPGVGRKTANVVLGTIFNIPSLVVDTHVTRITNLLKFANTKNAVLIENKMCRIVDKHDWSILAHLFIDHGRKICIANRPICSMCVIAKNCPSSQN